MPKTDITQNFLEKYKELEGILRSSDTPSVLQYEETLNTNDTESLRICRQIRNYMQHHENGTQFLTATTAMVNFIHDLIQSENSKNGIAKDRLYRLPAIKPDDTIEDAFGKFLKYEREWLPVTGKDGEYIGTLKLFPFLHIFSETSKRTKMKTILTEKNIKSILDHPDAIVKETQLNGLEGKDMIVMGKNRKYLGILKWG